MSGSLVTRRRTYCKNCNLYRNYSNIPLARHKTRNCQHRQIRQQQVVGKKHCPSSGSMYRDIEPTVSKNIKFKNANRQKEVLITRLRLGKCRLNKYLYDIKKHDDGQCTDCKVPETIKHVLLEFSTNGFRGQLLHLCQSSGIHLALNTILSHGSSIDLVYRLMTSLDRPI